MNPTATPQISTQRIRQTLENRINYLRQATPEQIGWLLDSFYTGGFEIAKLWDALERRNPTVSTVVGKRKADVGRMDWQILVRSNIAEGQEAQAQRHADALKGFYDTLTVTSTLKQDESGGVGLLAQQILDARGKEYSVHEWIWKLPRRGSPLTAEFRHCPMWWFENRTGRLRYLLDDGQMYGVPMDPTQWLVSAAPSALMEATTVAWLFMHASLNDWVTFCEKFGMPGLLGKTDAAPDSKEWNALVEAVKAFGQDWAAVVSRGAEIETVEAKGGASGIPYPPLVEAMKRDIITLWRGGDLSTLSAGQGQGQGASVQGEETDTLREDDARFVSEKLNERVDTQVIAYYFGAGVKPLAYFKLTPPSKPDTDRELRVDQFFLTNRLPLGRADLYERYSRRAPEDGEDPESIVTGSTSAPANTLPQESDTRPQLGLANTVQLLNAAADAADADATQELRQAATEEIAAAMGEALAPLRRRLAEIADLPDAISQRDALTALRTELPDMLRRAGKADSALAEAIEALLGASTVNGFLSAPEIPGERAAA
jgi:phage gp29-like protein